MNFSKKRESKHTGIGQMNLARMRRERLRRVMTSLYSSFSVYFSILSLMLWQREMTWSDKLQKKMNERLSDYIFMAYFRSILSQNHSKNSYIGMFIISKRIIKTNLTKQGKKSLSNKIVSPLSLIINMLDKYQSFIKLTSGPQCTLYSAFNRLTVQNALLKRIKPHLGTHQWNQILTHKQLTLTSKSKIFPKLNEIFRHKGCFFFAFEKPSGNSLSPQTPIEKQSHHSTIQLLADLLEGLKQLAEIIPNLVVFADWIFFHRNSLKVVHYQPFMQPEGEQKQHIATFDSEGLSSEEKDQIEIWPEQLKTSIVFHLGLIAYRLFTGKKEEEINSQTECQKYVELMRSNCERQIIKVTNDSKMANFVAKMISSNKFQVPTFQQTVNFFCRQANQQRQGQGKNKDYSLQIQIEKININTERGPIQPKRKFRNCCIKDEPTKYVGEQQFKKMGLNSEQQIKTAKKSKLILPYLSVKNSCSLPRKYATSANRHQFILSNPHQHDRYHAKSIGYLPTDPN